MLNDHTIGVQPYKVYMKEMDYGKWNECDGLSTEGNKN